jgi:hypothetical protein
MTNDQGSIPHPSHNSCTPPTPCGGDKPRNTVHPKYEFELQNRAQNRDPHTLCSLGQSKHREIQFTLTSRHAAMLECTVTDITLASLLGLVLYGKGLYAAICQINGSAEAVSVFCLSFGQFQHPHVRKRVRARELSSAFTLQDGGAPSFLRARAHALPQMVEEFIPYIAGGDKMTGVRHLTHDLAPGCARAVGCVHARRIYLFSPSNGSYPEYRQNIPREAKSLRIFSAKFLRNVNRFPNLAGGPTLPYPSFTLPFSFPPPNGATLVIAIDHLS